MNKEELNGLLDNIYELEGLVHLALVREDCPESLPELIVRKANSLTQLINTLGSSSRKNEDEHDVVPDIIENDDSDEIGEESVSEEDNIIVEEDNITVDDEDKVSIDEIPAAGIGIDSALKENCDIQNSVNESETVECPVIEKEEKSAFSAYTLPVEDPAPKHQKNIEPRGKLVFTINDRYRFKRDLFCNSDADFNTTLALVASMDSYDEAEDYFLGELQWSPKREEVMDFLEILKNYFK